MLRITARRTPLLGKEGWLRPLIKCREASFTGAAGVVGSTSDNRWLNLPLFLVSPCRAHIRSAHARLRPLRRLRGILLMGAATPPFQGGEFALRRLIPTIHSSYDRACAH